MKDGGAIPVATAPATAAVSIAGATSSSPLTLGDRQALLGEFSGELARSLGKTLRNSGPDAFDASLLKYMERRAGPAFFFNPKRASSLTALVNDKLSFKVPAEVSQADDIVAHLFPEQINSQTNTVQLGAEIDWDAQPESTDNADFLHSLNRQGFWKDLAMAYRLTGDGTYVRELVAQLTSWSAQTPALANPEDWEASSPHWWLLDASDRANNWTYAYFMVLGSSDWTPAANTLFLKGIWEHGDFLSRVTPAAYAKNRTAIHAAGLLRIGLMFPEFNQAAQWEYQGFDMTFRCLAAQFYPDGGHVEETPAYQASALDAFLENYRLAELNGRTAWTKNRRRLFVNGIEALYQLLTPAGQLPGVSDTYRSSTPREFLNRCGLVMGDDRYLLARATMWDVFLVGPEPLDGGSFNAPDPALYNRGPEYSLTDSGYYMLRDQYHETTPSSGRFVSGQQILFDAGPKGGTHGHYDLLSFEYTTSIADQSYVVDPGPFRYDDSPERQWAISTPAHNTISIDGLNHEAVEGPQDPRIVVDEFVTTATEVRITAHHHAYEYLKGRPTVGRTVWLDRDPTSQVQVAIAVDWGRTDSSRYPRAFMTNFTLPRTNVTRSAPGVVDVQMSALGRLRVQSLVQSGQTDGLADAFVSNNPPPDEQTPAKQYAVSQTGTSAVFVTMFSTWAVRKDGTVIVLPATIAFDTPPVDGQPVHLRLTMPDGSTRSLTFAPPDLSPLPVAAAPAAAPAPVSPFVSRATPFTGEPMPGNAWLFDEPPLASVLG
jgi:hypothetical protein